MAVVSDSLGDALTRIRNGQTANMDIVKVSFSYLILSVLIILKREGYIRSFSEIGVRKGVRMISVNLKYFSSFSFDSSPVILNIKRVSKPGRRVYSKIKDLNVICNGLGISILSTSKGVMSDHEARNANVGGEVLCTVL